MIIKKNLIEDNTEDQNERIRDKIIKKETKCPELPQEDITNNH